MQNRRSSKVDAEGSLDSLLFFVIPPLSKNAKPWNPHDETDLPVPDCAYFGRTLVAFAQRYCGPPLTIYLTWNLHELPSYGRNVVAIVLGDEWCRMPTYANRVLATFKCYGLKLSLPRRPRISQLAIMERLQIVANSIRAFRTNLLACVGGAGRERTNIWDIPLGYYRQVDLPIIPHEERPIDVFFAGSISQKQSRGPSSLRDFFRSPKSLSRDLMLRTLHQYAKNHPERKIESTVTASFEASANADRHSYSVMLQNAKICLVPRGSSLETFRWFEGMRSGCIVICEPLPPRRYYSESPAIELTEWSRLPAILDQLFSNKALCVQNHLRSLEWWHTQCSEAVVGEWIHSKLASIVC